MKQLFILISLLVVTLQVDAQNWVRTNGPVEDAVFDLCVAPNGWLFAMTQLGLNRSTDGGDHWTRPFQFSRPSSQQGRLIIAKNGNVIFSGDSGIYVSTDNGETFLQTFREEFGTSVAQFAISGSGKLFAARTWAVASNDHGLTWSDIDSAFGRIPLQTKSFAASNDTVVGPSGAGKDIYWSVNNGKDWSVWGKRAINTPLLFSAQDGSWVAVTPLDVFRQVDHSDTTSSSWKSIITSEFESDSIFFSFSVTEDGSMFLSTSNYLWMGKQFSNWRKVGSWFDFEGIVHRVVYDKLNKVYYLALMSGGVWKTSSPLAIEQQVKPIQLQICPNPLAATARVRCSPLLPTVIEIAISDNLGRTHRQYSKYLEAGISDIPISLNDLPNGSYYLHVKCGEQYETRNIVLTK